MRKPIAEMYRLSILLVTYNHSGYIRKALDSMLGQKFDGAIQLVIADDGSSDNTLSIIKEHEGKDSRFSFNYLANDINLGITKNYQRGFAACSGEYIAVLEGDDYWISPLKLQRQLDFLGNHWECDLCSVNYLVYEESRSHFYPRTTIGSGHRYVTAKELIADNLVGNFSTCMYRKSALDALPGELFEICSYDWIVNICVARTSVIGFLEEPMSTYRLHAKGVWTQASHIEKLKIQLGLIPAYDALTGLVFRTDFAVLAHRLNQTVYAAQAAQVAATLGQPTVSLLARFVEYLPPVILSTIRILTPPKLKRLLVRITQGVAS